MYAIILLIFAKFLAENFDLMTTIISVICMCTLFRLLADANEEHTEETVNQKKEVELFIVNHEPDELAENILNVHQPLDQHDLILIYTAFKIFH